MAGAASCTASTTALLACVLALASSAVVLTLVEMLSIMSAAGDVAASSSAVTRDDVEGGTALELPLACPLVDRFVLLGRGRSTRPLSFAALMLLLELGESQRTHITLFDRLLQTGRAHGRAEEEAHLATPKISKHNEQLPAMNILACLARIRLR